MTELIAIVALLLAGVAWFRTALIDHALGCALVDNAELGRRVAELERRTAPCLGHRASREGL